MRQAFAYLRVSGLGQVDGYGLDRQLDAITIFAKANGIEIVRVFREEGVTGTNDLDHRPALSALIAALLADGTTLVLIEKLDRLARALIVQETIVQDLMRRGFEVISVSEPDLCSDDPTRTLIRQILGAFFEYERKMIVSKLADARARKRKESGRCEGRKPYGARPGEQRILDTIVTTYREGASPAAIANMLDALKTPTRSGGRWHPATISRILRRVNAFPRNR